MPARHPPGLDLSGETPEQRLFAPPLGPRAYRWTVVIVLAALILLAVHVTRQDGSVDWLLVSATATLGLGLWLAHRLPDDAESTLERLASRGALLADPARLAAACRQIERQIARYWAPICGGIVATALLSAFLLWPGLRLGHVWLVAAATLGGYLAGCHLGRMACYGALGPILTSLGIELCVRPGHPDRVGGLQPLGDFYFRQALGVAIPAVFLAAWLLLFSLPMFAARYGDWREPYIGLLALAILLYGLAFVLPLWSFHRAMVRQKKQLRREADLLSRRIDEIRAELAAADPAADTRTLRDCLADRLARYDAIESLPVWPVSMRTRRIFGLNNIALVVPLLAQYQDLPAYVTDLAELLFGLAGS